MGILDSYEPPKAVMSNPPICANCHSYSLDGGSMIIDTDYGGDKGAFIFSSLKEGASCRNNK